MWGQQHMAVACQACMALVLHLFWLLQLLVVQRTWLQQHARVESSGTCQTMQLARLK
jgi:hypothetical protein